MQRREFCKRAAVGTAAAAGLSAGATTATAHPGSVPVVSTRGHFDVEWEWDFWNGGFRQVELEGGHSAYDYDAGPGVPRYSDDLTVVVHGYRKTQSGAAGMFETTRAGLRDEDHSGDVVGFSWDASEGDLGVLDWWEVTGIARRNGKKLTNFTTDHLVRNPGATVRYVAHSLGGQVVCEALAELDRSGDSIDSVALLGGAVDNDDVSGTYHSAIEDNCDEFDNYYDPGDDVLSYAYWLAELDGAVGDSGCEGNEPSNYEDHDVSHVPDHYSYYESGSGCLDDVVEEWNEDDGGAATTATAAGAGPGGGGSERPPAPYLVTGRSISSWTLALVSWSGPELSTTTWSRSRSSNFSW